MPSLTDQHKIILDQARGIAERAKAAGRACTAAEMKTIRDKVDAAEQLKAKIDEADAGQKLFNQVMSLGADGRRPGTGDGPTYLDLSPAGRKTLADRIASSMVGTVDGRKALLPAGETVVSVPVIPTDPIAEGKVAANLLSVLPTTQIPSGAQARYVRQTTRTNNAAPVAPGGTKPTSIFGLTPVDVALKVYAHLSEPTDRFLIEDSEVLARFLASELTYGLTQAVETDVLVGADPNGITGMLNVSGVRTIPFDTDLITTTRKAVTAAESAGYASSLVFALSPADWESIELSTAVGSGDFVLPTAPVDRASQRLWGVPVVTVADLPAATAALFDRTATSLYVDTAGVRVDWGTPADTWTRNQLVARAEGRFDLAVYQPAAVAKITTGTVGP